MYKDPLFTAVHLWMEFSKHCFFCRSQPLSLQIVFLNASLHILCLDTSLRMTCRSVRGNTVVCTDQGTNCLKLNVQTHSKQRYFYPKIDIYYFKIQYTVYKNFLQHTNQPIFQSCSCFIQKRPVNC